MLRNFACSLNVFNNGVDAKSGTELKLFERKYITILIKFQYIIRIFCKLYVIWSFNLEKFLISIIIILILHLSYFNLIVILKNAYLGSVLK